MNKVRNFILDITNVRILFLCLKRLFLSFELRSLYINQCLSVIRLQVGEKDLIKLLFCLRNFFMGSRLTNISCVDTLLYRYRSFEKRFLFTV